MPLSKIQIEILRLLASQRDPESYVAGSTPLNRNALRFSGDIDVFHDREERVAAAALNDAGVLEAADYQVKWLRQSPAIYTAQVSRPEAGTRLEWVADSDFRFFPTVKDELFGYVLHPVDLALNKVMAAADRREVRDVIDLVTIDRHILPLGAALWAAVEKSPGYTPDGLLGEIRRNAHYPVAEWRAVASEPPLDPAAIRAELGTALDGAERFIHKMPTDRMGLLFLENGAVVQPIPERLDEYETHAGQRRGQWPTSGEIGTAMLDYYKRTSGE